MNSSASTQAAEGGHLKESTCDKGTGGADVGSNSTNATTNVTDFCSRYTRGGTNDKIAGLIFGHALGDAVGLTTEFKDPPPATVEFPYSESIRGVPSCEWTDDTDLLILTMGSLMDNNMTFVPRDIIDRFTYWIHNGLIYTGEKAPKTPNGTFKYIVSHKLYRDDYAGVAKSSLADSKGALCNNSPITRIAIVGTMQNPITPAVNFCTLTHVDPRCVASCVFYSCIINRLIYDPDRTPSAIDSHIELAKNTAISHIGSYSDEFCDIIRMALRGRLVNLKLGEKSGASHVYKCLSCIVYTLHVIKIAVGAKKKPDFKKCIIKVALEGGDADANCIMVGSILGCWLGYQGLPKDWIAAMPNAESLNKFAAVYMSRLFTPTTFEENASASNAQVQNVASEPVQNVASEVSASEPVQNVASEVSASEPVQNAECAVNCNEPVQNIVSEVCDVTVSEPTVSEPTVSEPTVSEPTVSEPTQTAASKVNTIYTMEDLESLLLN